jgi:predicted ATPase
VRTTPAPVSRPPFVGREHELRELERAFAQSSAGGAVAVVVRGESGVGKSALLDKLVESLGTRALALTSRCQERETVPYKAFDGVIDALSRYLSRLGKAEIAAQLAPEALATLARLFPVLSRLEALAALPPAPTLSSPELQTRGFAALRQLLTRVRARQPVVIVIDDYQWADADSMALRREVLRDDGPAILLVTSARSDAFPRPELFEAAGDLRQLELARLPASDARALVDQLFAYAGVDDPDGAAQIVEGAQGHPLYLAQLVRDSLESGARGAGLDAAIWARIRRLDEPLRRVVELVAVAGRPLAQEIAAACAELEFSEFARLSTVLRAANLVRTSGARRSDTVEPYHDLVRAAVMHHLAPDEVRGYQQRVEHAAATIVPTRR